MNVSYWILKGICVFTGVLNIRYYLLDRSTFVCPLFDTICMKRLTVTTIFLNCQAALSQYRPGMDQLVIPADAFRHSPCRSSGAWDYNWVERRSCEMRAESSATNCDDLKCEAGSIGFSGFWRCHCCPVSRQENVQGLEILDITLKHFVSPLPFS